MSNTISTVQEPIFIHSLFRSGSTYLFKAFRRSQTSYWCYQEPLHEELLHAATEPETLLEIGMEFREYVRHPELDKPYFYEFHQIAKEVGERFHKEFSYDQYFADTSEKHAELHEYFNALIRQAQSRPVLQCCRTTGRVMPLQKEHQGTHIYLWRNPWNQWWSYKKGFNRYNLLIINASNLPPFFQAIKKELNIPDFHHPDIYQELAFFSKHWMDSQASYSLFYAIWCHAMLEAKRHCELSISIDNLSTSNDYRHMILEELKHLGIGGLNFSDCSVPMPVYGENEGEFFLQVETHIHELLLANGYDFEQVNELIQLGEERTALLVDTKKPENAVIRDAMHVREYQQAAEKELAEDLIRFNDIQEKLQMSADRISDLERDISDLNTSSKIFTDEGISVQEKISQLNQASQYWQSKANQLDEELTSVYASKSWRTMLSLRKITHFFKRLFRQPIKVSKGGIISVMAYVIAQPRLKNAMISILLKFPRIKAYLNKIALSAGLSTKQNLSSGVAAQGLAKNKTALQEHSHHLSAQTAQIYVELQDAFEMRSQ